MGPITIILLYGLTFLLLFVSAEWLYRVRSITTDTTRRYVHIGTGVLTMGFPLILSEPWSIYLLCGLFLIILVISLRTQHLQSINGVNRTTYGSLYYPIVVALCYWYSDLHDQFLYFYLPLIIMALADPCASFVGRRYRYRPYRILGQTKTLGGSFAFFCCALCLSIGFLSLSTSFGGNLVLTTFLIAVMTTCVEAVSHRGLDNLTIPLSAVFILSLTPTL